MKQETKEIVDRLREEGLQRFRESGHHYTQLSHSQQLEIPATTRPPPEINEQQMWDEFELDRLNASLLDANAASQFNPAQQCKVNFNRALDRAEANDLTEWGFEDFGIECDVDETLTNVMQNLGQSPKPFVPGSNELMTLSDLDDLCVEDAALADIGLGNPGSAPKSDEWFPYPNKIASVSQWGDW